MDVREINVITLAYLGDAIYEMYIRNYLIKSGIALVDDLQKAAIRYVSAKGQDRILKLLITNNYLFDEELAIVKRGRNYNRVTHPKNTNIMTYKMATGFEALIGYLYLDNQKKRIDEIINYILEEYHEENI